MAQHETSDYTLHWTFHTLNITALIALAGLLIAYIWIGQVQNDYPYDYGILQFGGELFCFQPDEFAYGDEYLYPAPFYTTFCGAFRYAPDALYWAWMIAPFVLALMLSGQRAAVLVFAPFYIHMVLGQSTWLIVPLYWLALIADRQQQVRWWYGLFVPLALLKPHIAILPFVWLFYHGRRQITFLVTAIVATVLVMLPSFLLEPAWVSEWLSAGRGYKIPSIANIGIIPIQLLQLGESQLPRVHPALGQLVVLFFGGAVAWALLCYLQRRRTDLIFYDWALVFALTNPFMHDYDLIILLPFLANRPKRLLLALTAGLAVWVYAQMTTYYNASSIIPLTLLVARFLRVDEHDPRRPPARW